MPKKKKTVLYAFQKECEQELDEFDGLSILALSPGLGKTLLALRQIARHVPDRPAVVVCPADIKEHWKREAEKHVNRRVEILDHRTPTCHRLSRGQHLYVINYDILGIPAKSVRTWCELLRRIRPGIVVFDESHRLKDPFAKRSHAARALVERTKRVLLLSGTPTVSRPIELWHQAWLVRPDVFPNRVAYGLKYCNGKKKYGIWDFSGASNLPELNCIIRNEFFIRRRKEDVLKDLPPKTRDVVPFILPLKSRLEYHKAVSEFLVWLRKKRPKSKALYQAQQLAKVGYLKRLAAELKLPHAMNWIEDFLASGEKLLFYGIHHDFLKPLYAKFRKVSVLVNGESPTSLRQTMYDRFNNDPECKILFGNIQAAGTGWSCQSTSNVAFGELDWVPGNHEQAEDRVRGINRGTGRPVTAYYLVSADTIEYDLCGLLESKAQVLSAVHDGRDTQDMTVFNALLRKLSAQNLPMPKKKKARA